MSKRYITPKRKHTKSRKYHGKCEGYLDRVKKQQEINNKRREISDFNGYIHDTVDIVKRVCKLNKQNRKKYR